MMPLSFSKTSTGASSLGESHGGGLSRDPAGRLCGGGHHGGAAGGVRADYVHAGETGRLFSEFAITLAVSVAFSGFVALTLSPMLASKILSEHRRENWITQLLERGFDAIRTGYRAILGFAVKLPWIALPLALGLTACCGWLLTSIPTEFTPREDRGSFFVTATGPPGSTFNYTMDALDQMEDRLMYLNETTKEATRVLIRAPRSFSGGDVYNEGIGVVTLADFGHRRNGFVILDEVRARVSDIPGVKTAVIMRQGLTRGLNKTLEIVVGGPTFEELAEWRDIILEKAKANPKLIGLDCDYRDTKPQVSVSINRDRAADLGVSSAAIGRTLETLLGSRRVTTFIHEGRNTMSSSKALTETSRRRSTSTTSRSAASDRANWCPWRTS